MCLLNIRDVTLVTLGLDNAGKSTVISVIINSELYLSLRCIHSTRGWAEVMAKSFTSAGIHASVLCARAGDQDNVATTVGYTSNQAQLRKCSVTISDLGGGSRIRGIWGNYYAEVRYVRLFYKAILIQIPDHALR